MEPLMAITIETDSGPITCQASDELSLVVLVSPKGEPIYLRPHQLEALRRALTQCKENLHR